MNTNESVTKCFGKTAFLIALLEFFIPKIIFIYVFLKELGQFNDQIIFRPLNMTAEEIRFIMNGAIIFVQQSRTNGEFKEYFFKKTYQDSKKNNKFLQEYFEKDCFSEVIGITAFKDTCLEL